MLLSSAGFMKTYKGTILFLVALCFSVLAVYVQVRDHGFISFDDREYVVENRHIHEGLSRDGILWAFSIPDKRHDTYWHPVTWLSHMLDIELFGLNPGMHHLMNVLLHLVNSVLLYAFLRWTTGMPFRSAIVSLLFALHPINVDSVAWIAERKNLLSTMFWLSTMLMYAHYAMRPGLLRYTAVLSIFTLGLLAKPMLVTLPCILLLMDYWPLGRIRFANSKHLEDDKETDRAGFARASLARLVVEKIPLLILSFLAIFLSLLSLERLGTSVSQKTIPIGLRICNAIVSYVHYVWKLFWPADLTIFYPYPSEIPLWMVAGSLLLVAAISFAAVRAVFSKPPVAIGWLWYLVTLVPVLGFVQGGLWPAIAERWAYIPCLGIFIMLVWSLSDLAEKMRPAKPVLTALLIPMIFVTGYLAHRQAGFWKNDFTLFSHALAVNQDDYVAHLNLGAAFMEKGDLDGAVRHYQEILRIRP